MKNLCAVFKATLKSTFGTSAFRWRYIKRRERLWEPLLFGVAVFSGVSVYGFGLYQVGLAIASMGKAVGQPELVLGTALAAVQTIVLLLGPFFIISAFYFAKDLNLLLALPLRPKTIVYAKFGTVLAGEYLTVILLYAPFVAAYARFSDFTVGHALLSAVVFLLAPVLPLAFASVGALVLMRFINREHRDLYMIAFTIILVVFVLGFQALAIRLAPDNPEQALSAMIESRLGFLKAVTRNFPPLIWAALAIHLWPSLNAFGYLGLTLLSAAAALVLLGAIGEQLFLRGLMGSNESSRRLTLKRARIRDHSLEPPNSAFKALFLREWRLFFKTPIWWLNGCLPPLIIPLATLLPLWQTGQLENVLGHLVSETARTYVGLGLSAILAFAGSMNGLAATAISREGKHFWISRSIPQSARLQTKAKLAAAAAVIAITSIPMLAAYAGVLKPGIIHILWPTVIGLVASFSASIFGLGLDILRPMLLWENPQEPVKRNLNVLFPLALPALYALGGVPLIGALVLRGFGPVAIYSAILLPISAITFLLWKSLVGKAEAGYLRIEP